MSVLQVVVGVVLLAWAVFVFFTSTFPLAGLLLVALGAWALVAGIRGMTRRTPADR